jgi:hypothetical protein
VGYRTALRVPIAGCPSSGTGCFHRSPDITETVARFLVFVKGAPHPSIRCLTAFGAYSGCCLVLSGEEVRSEGFSPLGRAKARTTNQAESPPPGWGGLEVRVVRAMTLPPREGGQSQGDPLQQSPGNEIPWLKIQSPAGTFQP